jgi:hypothetical protein
MTNRIVYLVSASVLGLGTLATLAPPSQARGTCSPARTRVLVENHVALVFRYTTADEQTVACVRSTKEQIPLDSPIDRYEAFGPPAIDLAGPVLGYAIEQCDERNCRTLVKVDDLRGDKRDDAVGTVVRASSKRRRVKVGSLRVRRNGGVAWTTCPDRSAAGQATQRPNCTGPGDAVRVVKLNAGARTPRELDHGRSIDPSSLRLSHGRVSWLDAGVRRHARLR